MKDEELRAELKTIHGGISRALFESLEEIESNDPLGFTMDLFGGTYVKRENAEAFLVSCIIAGTLIKTYRHYPEPINAHGRDRYLDLVITVLEGGVEDVPSLLKDYFES